MKKIFFFVAHIFLFLPHDSWGIANNEKDKNGLSFEGKELEGCYKNEVKVEPNEFNPDGVNIRDYAVIVKVDEGIVVSISYSGTHIGRVFPILMRRYKNGKEYIWVNNKIEDGYSTGISKYYADYTDPKYYDDPKYFKALENSDAYMCQISLVTDALLDDDPSEKGFRFDTNMIGKETEQYRLSDCDDLFQNGVHAPLSGEFISYKWKVPDDNKKCRASIDKLRGIYGANKQKFVDWNYYDGLEWDDLEDFDY